MSLLQTLKRIGAEVSNVSVSYRNKDTGEQIRGAAIEGGCLDLFDDPKLRANAIATCAGKAIGFSVTDPSNVNETVSGKLNPVDVAATIAYESGMVSESDRLLALRDNCSELDALKTSTKSVMDASRNLAARMRNAATQQARKSVAIVNAETEPATKPNAAKPEAVATK